MISDYTLLKQNIAKKKKERLRLILAGMPINNIEIEIGNLTRWLKLAMIASMEKTVEEHREASKKLMETVKAVKFTSSKLNTSIGHLELNKKHYGN